MKTKAYYVTGLNSEEFAYHDVIVTTEHPLSSYGQPVVIEQGEATPAQNWSKQLNVYYKDATEPARDLVAKANRLGGRGGMSVAEEKAAFSSLFSTKSKDA